MGKFHQYKTDYDIFCKQVKKVTPEKFYNHMFDYFKQIRAVEGGKPVLEFDDCRIMLEVKWVIEQRPYYNIHPNVIEPIERMRLDNIPASFLTVPRQVTAAVINFPIDSAMKNIFVAKFSPNKMYIAISHGENHFVHFSYNTDVTESIEKVIQFSIENMNPEEYKSKTLSMQEHAKYVRMAVRTIAMCKFLTDCPNEDFMTYDISSKFKNEWKMATPQRREEIVKRSREHGLNGMNVVLAHHLYAPRLSEPKEDGNGKEQQYAHIRTGHFHAVRYGVNKEHVKIMWFRPTVVNEGKPFKTQE